MIYFDNSATTYTKPKEVIKSFMEGITTYSANPGRSGHTLSMLTSEKIFSVRQQICDFFGVVKPEHVIFTQNCTDALNLGVLGTIKRGGHIICSCNDHNSLARPIFELERQGIVEITVVSPKNKGFLTADDIAPHIKSNTYLVALNYVSNVNGDVAYVKEIGDLCLKNNILFLVDCAQSAGHIKIDMERDHIDMIAVAPHKALYSPQGIGIFAFGVRPNIKPIRYGGTGTASIEVYQPNEYPECLESGTLATPNILALGAGLKFVKENFEKINKKINDLSTYLLFELSKIENIKVYTYADNVHFGVIGFNIINVDSGEIAERLSNEYGIYVRGGLHCAGLKHKHLGTVSQGVVRISISYFNTFTECENFIKVIKKLAKQY